MKWKSDEAMKRGDNAGSLTLLTIGLKNGWSRDATPADIIAALKANPEARAEVLDALGEPPASRHLDVAAAIARAEQAERELATLRAKLARCEAVVEAARECMAPDLGGPFDLDDPSLIEVEARFAAALRALDNDSGGSGAAAGNTASPVPDMPAQAGEQPGGGDTTSGDTRPPAPAGSYRVPIGCGVAAVDSAGSVIWWEPGDPLRPTPEAPATRREVEELRRDILTTVMEVCELADQSAYAPWPWPLTRLAAMLRQRLTDSEGRSG